LLIKGSWDSSTKGGDNVFKKTIKKDDNTKAFSLNSKSTKTTHYTTNVSTSNRPSYSIFYPYLIYAIITKLKATVIKGLSLTKKS
jgi:hypothetical protein